MKKYTDEQIISIYLEKCAEIEQGTLTGEYKKSNAAGKILKNIFKHFETNHEQAQRILSILLTNRNVVARCKAAAYCLSLSILKEEAIKALIEASKDDSLGIFAFNAEMILKVYREQGYLRIYPTQKIDER